MLLLLLGVAPTFPISLGVTSGLSWPPSPPSPDPVSVLLGSESAVRSKVLKQEHVSKVETLVPSTSALWVSAGASQPRQPRREASALQCLIVSAVDLD